MLMKITADLFPVDMFLGRFWIHLYLIIFCCCCRTMQKHMKQLSDWLREEEAKGHDSDDEDIQNAQQEVLEVSQLQDH